MTSLVKIYEKPISHTEPVDWIRNIQELQRYSFERVQSAFDVRYDVRKAREEDHINAKWNKYRNTKLLRDKVDDISFWVDEFKNKMNQFAPIIKQVEKEKLEVDEEINKMEELFRVSSECNSLRNKRMLKELVNDRVREELRNEILLAEDNKKLLQKLSHCAWEKLNYLYNLQFRLNQELEQKVETMVIDSEQANMDVTAENLSYRIDAMKIAKHSESKEAWTKKQQAMLAEAEYQLTKSIEARETLFLVRGKARDLMDAQRMATENVLRRRIHENSNSIKELEWHKQRLETAMGKFSHEMQQLENEIEECMKKLKLAETRLINKTYRAIGEKCLDLANEAIRLEARTLNDFLADLRKRRGATKVAYNELERQYRAITDDLLYKKLSLELDEQVFNIKENLKIITKQTQFERTVKLLNFKFREPEENGHHSSEHKGESASPGVNHH